MTENFITAARLSGFQKRGLGLLCFCPTVNRLVIGSSGATVFNGSEWGNWASSAKKVSPPHLCIQRPGHISHNRKVVYYQPGKSLSESKQADWDDWQRDVTCSVRPGHDFRYPPAKLHASPDIRAAPRPISSPSNLKRLALEIVPLKCWSTHHDGAHNASCVDSRLIAHTFL